MERMYKKLLKQSKNTFKQNLAQKLQDASMTDPKMYWKILEDLRNIDKIESDSVNPISGEEWVDHFTRLFAAHGASNTESDKATESELSQLEKQEIFNELSFCIQVSEIEKAVKDLKIGKASGPDSINSEILKCSSRVIAPILQKVFNHILTEGKYPETWAEGIITPLHKKGNLHDPDNYRGITVASTLGKVFGMILNNRLADFCVEHNLIDERQASHKKKSRTSDNAFIIRSLFEKHCVQQKQKLYLCFVDFSKAFDSIWHDGMFLKLQQNGIGGPFYRVIKDMYSKVTASVKGKDGSLSSTFPIRR